MNSNFDFEFKIILISVSTGDRSNRQGAGGLHQDNRNRLMSTTNTLHDVHVFLF